MELNPPSLPLTLQGVSDLDLSVCLFQLYYHLVMDLFMKHLVRHGEEGEGGDRGGERRGGGRGDRGGERRGGGSKGR